MNALRAAASAAADTTTLLLLLAYAPPACGSSAPTSDGSPHGASVLVPDADGVAVGEPVRARVAVADAGAPGDSVLVRDSVGAGETLGGVYAQDRPLVTGTPP